jgi:hypothetical protein
MIMSTFAESFNFIGKTFFPFTTYAVSGLGTTVRPGTSGCNATWARCVPKRADQNALNEV